jgi:hypothetical protein
VWEETLKVSSLLRRRLKNFAWLLLVLTVAGLFSYWPLCVRGTGEASMSVGNADVAVRQAFNATLDAERAGANVSGLIARLNEAGGALTDAENALRAGNSSVAASEASLCIGIAESVKSDADILKTSALDKDQTVFQNYLTFSVMSIAVFIVVLALVWRRFKYGYNKRVLGMKPEVAANEA